MTEEDAKTKWCCGPKIIADEHHGKWLLRKQPAEPAPPNLNGFCVGSACMAWRWASAERSVSGKPVETWPDLIPFHNPGELLVRKGFCGLAGKP